MPPLAPSPWFLTADDPTGTAAAAAATTASAQAPAAAGPDALLFCFPHAGGNPRTFLGWQDALGRDGRVLALCPPGRGHRFREPAPASVAELADGAAAAVTAVTAGTDLPFLLFGHSFGAALAFEVARRIDGRPGFAGLVASGCSAPSLLPTPRVVETARLTGRAFTEAVAFFGGLPPELAEDEVMQELLLPHLKADFRLVAEYAYRPAAPLTVPVTLVNGTGDPHVSPGAVAPWARECTAEPARHWTDGGHFYFEDRPAAVAEVLRPLLRAATASARTADEYVELI
ncbi:alpha/beta fold hydrolase [Streptomyces sp. NPDC089919]|uniref:thioesterase II family protein n=1 Tax=Streptomyces sp. NPDC089919 TaxID=3155188 RepID=UPI0034208BCB